MIRRYRIYSNSYTRSLNFWLVFYKNQRLKLGNCLKVSKLIKSLLSRSFFDNLAVKIKKNRSIRHDYNIFMKKMKN
jgi:hypothetical protein